MMTSEDDFFIRQPRALLDGALDSVGVTELLRAFSIAPASRAFVSGSAPPSLAATMISRTSLTTICPRFCAGFRPACFIVRP